MNTEDPLARSPREHLDTGRLRRIVLTVALLNLSYFFVVDGPAQVPEDATAFDMPSVDLSHHGCDCTFETLLRRDELGDPALWRRGEVVHEADIDDGLFDAPEAPGVDVALRGLSMVLDDDTILAVTGPLFDGLHEFFRRELLLGKEPS